jgi:hypothetical protein
VQEVRAAAPTHADTAADVSLRALLLAGAFPLIPPEKLPRNLRPGAMYGDFTPVTLLAGVGEAGAAAMQLGTAALKAAGKAGKAVASALTGGSSEGEAGGAATENGAPRPSVDGGSRPGLAAPVAPSPTAAAASSAAATKPRRQPPPPPPKM